MHRIGPDRIRELLDAVLDDSAGDLADMAMQVHASPHHFARQVSEHAGESPVAMRRRVLLERAAWQLSGGASVTETAFDAGYESVDGFSRAFTRAYGFAPSSMPPRSARGHWLASPNGVHFHSPTVLYVDGGRREELDTGDVLTTMIRHDLDEIDALLVLARPLPQAELQQVRSPGMRLHDWGDGDETILQVLGQLVRAKATWIATMRGDDAPDWSAASVVSLQHEHELIRSAWLDLVRDLDATGGWHDSVIDTLCDPPERFVIGDIAAHVLTLSLQRRGIARIYLHAAGVDMRDLDPDPIMWHRQMWKDTE